MATRQDITQIAFLIPPTPGYLLDVVMGVQEHARTAGNWSMEVLTSFQGAEYALRTWRPDGVFVNAIDGDWETLINRLEVPTVQIGGVPLAGIPQMRTDNESIGKLAASYLADRGFRQFAYIGYGYIQWSRERGQAFEQALASRGLSCHMLLGEPADIHTSQVTGKLAAWMRQLPKPIAIFACQDRAAMLIGHACSYLGLEVPEQVAILGVDNNPFECRSTNPPISSIMGSGRRIGYQAAVLLDEIMQGRKDPPAKTLVEPAGVETRASTDIFAVADPDVAAALRYIEKNAGESFTVDDVVKAVFTSRRMLERKFRSLLHQSPRDRILRAHIERAKQLLMQTDHSMLDVALRSGFPSGSKLSAVFKRETRMTPIAFRRLYGQKMSRSLG